MQYVYHLIPDPMIGDSLITLNDLRSISEQEYKKHVSKYDGREYLLDQKIGILNSRWNDVIHFSTLEPGVIWRELQKIEPATVIRRRFYLKIEASRLESLNAVLMDYGMNKPYVPFDVSLAQFTPFESKSYVELLSPPKRTLDFWAEAKRRGDPLLLFNFIPHVFVKGPIPLSLGEVCELRL